MSEITVGAVRQFLHKYTREMVESDEDPASILDRYLEPTCEWHNDGRLLSRANLIAHAKPVRKHKPDSEIRIDDLVVAGTKFAVRYVLTAHHPKRGEIVIDIYMMGEVAEDGRMRRIDQITRTV